MIEKIEGLVVDMVRHNERHNVVTLYTRTRGRVAFLVPVGKSKAGKKRNAEIQPLACLSGEVNFKSGRELHSLTGVMPARLWRTLYFNPLKSSLLFFISDFLSKFLRQSPPDAALYDYIKESLRWLDEEPDASRTANFHLAFLKGMLLMAGIMPDVSGYREGLVLDMQQGVFVDPALVFGRYPSVMLSPVESAFVAKLGRMNFRNMRYYRFTRAERNAVVERMLQYFSLHLSMSFQLKSLEVLRDIFG